MVATDSDATGHNDIGGLIRGDGGDAFASIIQLFSGDTNTVTNDGTMTGSVQLFSFNGSSVTNTSSNTWNTAGLNFLLSGGANVSIVPPTGRSILAPSPPLSSLVRATAPSTSALAKGDVRSADDIDGVSGKTGLRWT